MPRKTSKPMKDLPATDTSEVTGGGFAGIRELISVTQMQAQGANNAASSSSAQKAVVGGKKTMG